MIERSGRQIFNPQYRFLLDSPERNLWQKPRSVLEASGVREGSVVADIGAGTGYFTRPASELVGESGMVYATDVQSEMVAELRSLAERSERRNIEVVESDFDSARLPEGCCDVALFANVYKEIDPRVPYLRDTVRALREQGRVVIVGFDPDVPGPGPPHELRLSEDEVIAECHEAGLRLSERHDFLPFQYMLVFERAAAHPSGSRELTGLSEEHDPSP